MQYWLSYHLVSSNMAGKSPWMKVSSWEKNMDKYDKIMET
jgi:hypothetical protein